MVAPPLPLRSAPRRSGRPVVLPTYRVGDPGNETMEQRAIQRQRQHHGKEPAIRPDARDEATLRNTMRDAIDQRSVPRLLPADRRLRPRRGHRDRGAAAVGAPAVRRAHARPVPAPRRGHRTHRPDRHRRPARGVPSGRAVGPGSNRRPGRSPSRSTSRPPGLRVRSARHGHPGARGLGPRAPAARPRGQRGDAARPREPVARPRCTNWRCSACS